MPKETQLLIAEFLYANLTDGIFLNEICEKLIADAEALIIES